MDYLEKFIQTYDWNKEIEPYLDTLQVAEGGYSSARRGIVTIVGGKRIFVKMALGDDLMTKWLRKEVKAYRILNQAGYPYIPKLLSYSDDESAMAIEYLAGASFESTWDDDKLNAIIKAQEALRPYKEYFADDPDFALDSVVDREVKWPIILTGNNIEIINQKLVKLDAGFSLTKEQILDLQKSDEGWFIKSDTLVHQDIRADNFGYYADQKTGKLIDWNWLCLGDESLDRTPLFVNMYMLGFDPYQAHPGSYDEKMLAYMVSFWIDQILTGNEDSSALEFRRRKSQASSVKTCLELIKRGK
jgi:hypothetical protein